MDRQRPGIHHGQHIAFECPVTEGPRTTLIGHRKSRAELDEAIWVQDRDDTYDAGEEWFTTMYALLA